MGHRAESSIYRAANRLGVERKEKSVDEMKEKVMSILDKLLPAKKKTGEEEKKEEEKTEVGFTP